MATIAHQKAHQALALLQRGMRDEAAQELAIGVHNGPANGPFWESYSKLADHIGEIDTAIEAIRRFSRTEPMLLSRYLLYWGMLAKHGREAVALEEIARLPAAIQDHSSVVNFRGQMAAQAGEFEQASVLYRRVVDGVGFSPQTWFALSAIANFKQEPELLDRMLALQPKLDHKDTDGTARYYYAIARGYHDLNDYDKSFEYYSKGAQIRRSNENYDREQLVQSVDRLINQYSARSLTTLESPRARFKDSIFVTGLPRSGTTLMQQILTAHDDVYDGGEVSLLPPALIPTGDHSLVSARLYQGQMKDKDPWGRIASAYGRMVRMRFDTPKRIVDKTLLQSHLMGLLLHTLPDCPVIWMRRSPEDVALSCFRNYFSGALPWTWSLADIGHYMTQEDRLFAHWTREFPDRIMVVPYEELVSDPTGWITKIRAHTGLSYQDSMEHFYLTKGRVKTASLQQVRQPITKDRIGIGSSYHKWLGEFWSHYQNDARP